MEWLYYFSGLDCQKVEFLEFPGSPVVWTPRFQYRKRRCHGYLLRELQFCRLQRAALHSTPPKKKKKKRYKGVLKLWKMISPEVTDKLIYTQSAKNCWSQYLGEDSSPPEKVPACGAEWLIPTPVTLPPTFPSVLLYWAIHSLTEYLHCLQHRSSVLWWFLVPSFSEWKSLEESTSERRVLEISKPLNCIPAI